MKEKDMILSNFYQGKHTTIVIHMTLFQYSFNMHYIIYENYYKIETKDRYLVQI